jgi:hypothetical protein
VLPPFAGAQVSQDPHKTLGSQESWATHLQAAKPTHSFARKGPGRARPAGAGAVAGSPAGYVQSDIHADVHSDTFHGRPYTSSPRQQSAGKPKGLAWGQESSPAGLMSRGDEPHPTESRGKNPSSSRVVAGTQRRLNFVPTDTGRGMRRYSTEGPLNPPEGGGGSPRGLRTAEMSRELPAGGRGGDGAAVAVSGQGGGIVIPGVSNDSPTAKPSGTGARASMVACSTPAPECCAPADSVCDSSEGWGRDALLPGVDGGARRGRPSRGGGGAG